VGDPACKQALQDERLRLTGEFGKRIELAAGQRAKQVLGRSSRFRAPAPGLSAELERPTRRQRATGGCASHPPMRETFRRRRSSCGTPLSSGGIMANKASPITDGLHSLTPNLTIKDASKAIDWYVKALGAEELC
jgi:hypothetical protein